MLTELKFEDGNVRFRLANEVNISIITPERRRLSNEALGLPTSRMAVPPGMVEVAMTNDNDTWFDEGGRIEEWEEFRSSQDLPLYIVTEQQVLDYINKVGVKCNPFR